MSYYSRRALGALAAAALSCISVIGLQATAASAAGDPVRQCYVLDGKLYPCTPADSLTPVADELSPREYDPSTHYPPAWEEDATKPVPGNDHSGPIAGDVQLASGSERPVVEHPPVRVETAAATERPVTENPRPKPIWCTDIETGEVFQCGSLSSASGSSADASASLAPVAYDFWDEGRQYGR